MSSTTTSTSPTTKFIRKTRAQLHKITSNESHDPAVPESSREEILPEDQLRQAERQGKLDRLARSASIKSTSSSTSTTPASYREIEMGGARKMGPDEVGKMFD